jgi:hypothetical protein
MQMTAHMYKSEANLGNSVLSLHMGSEVPTMATKLRASAFIPEPSD